MQAICFDFDGTLVDSEVFHAANWSLYMASHDVELSADVFMHKYAGVTWPNIAKILIEKFQLNVEPQQIVDDMEALTEEQIRVKGIPAKEGAETLLKQLTGKVPLAVVTGAPRIYVEGILAQKGWLEWFDVIFTGDDVEHNKPAPDIYQLACQHFELPTESVIAVEDSTTGATSALTAGLKTIFVNTINLPISGQAARHFSDLIEAQPTICAMLSLDCDKNNKQHVA
ncbi:TPA: HAD family hydrolase [Photobacterium damselae]